ncbi:MAG: 3-dehydroquinate synthase, partial [Planctomycetes bacterium]|nr:3-dehydroquinate synthase [Planctomycetota bacterium]
METVRVDLGDRSYDIQIGSRVLAELPRLMRGLKLGEDVFVLTSPTIRRHCGQALERVLAGASFHLKVVETPDGEESKSLATYERVAVELMAFDRKRQITVLALGGGVVGDLGGFVAATYKRGLGVDYVQVPTTLLAHVDSSVGGKVAINLRGVKNMLGAFYQPRLVFIELDFLKTLPLRELKSGLAEVIKYGVIFDRDFFEYVAANYERILRLEPDCLSHIVKKSCEFKAATVAADERDTRGQRALLNYGHTVGHAIEAATSESIYTHGEAVALGMICAARLGAELGACGPEVEQRIRSLLAAIGYETAIRGCTV